jgi:spore coat polysaccharide biosynthesis predicted glycosyltransferase SpsG
MMQPHFVFRVDGGNLYSVAMGHVCRCLHFADYLNDKNAGSITFLMKNFSESVGKVKTKYPVVYVPQDLNVDEEADFLLSKINNNATFICDIRGINNTYIKKLKQKVSLFCYFDDIGVSDINPDILINPSPYATMNLYTPADSSKYLLGLDYFILDRSIYKTKKESLNTNAKKILLSFGGADPTDITGAFVADMTDFFKEYFITVIIGCAYDQKREEQLKEMINTRKTQGFTIELKKDVPNLYPFFLETDIAVVAGGDTCLESIFTGTPTFIISSIDYEERTACWLQEKGIALHIGFIERDSMEKILANIENGLTDEKLSKDLFEKGKSAIDGKGIERVANKILEKVS